MHAAGVDFSLEDLASVSFISGREKQLQAPGGSRSSLLLGCVALAWCVRHPVWIHCTIMYNLSRTTIENKIVSSLLFLWWQE